MPQFHLPLHSSDTERMKAHKGDGPRPMVQTQPGLLQTAYGEKKKIKQKARKRG